MIMRVKVRIRLSEIEEQTQISVKNISDKDNKIGTEVIEINNVIKLVLGKMDEIEKENVNEFTTVHTE